MTLHAAHMLAGDPFGSRMQRKCCRDTDVSRRFFYSSAVGPSQVPTDAAMLVSLSEHGDWPPTKKIRSRGAVASSNFSQICARRAQMRQSLVKSDQRGVPCGGLLLPSPETRPPTPSPQAVQ